MLAFSFMNIQTATQYMKLGYRARRPHWVIHNYWIDWERLVFVEFSREELLADDWEIITQGIIQDFPILYQE